MPPRLIPKFWELIKESGKVTKMALGVDLRSRSFFEEIQNMLIEIENTNSSHIVHSKIISFRAYHYQFSFSFTKRFGPNIF